MNKTVYEILAIVKNIPKAVAFSTQVLFVSFFLSAVQANEDSQTAVAPSPKLMPVSLQINWNHQFQFAGFYAALKEGYYQKAGLDVSIKVWRPGVDVVDEVVSRTAPYIFIASLIFGLLLAAIIWLYISNKARNKLEAYIEKVNELRLATVLDKNGMITWVSKRYCVLTGYDPEDLIGKPYHLFKPDSMTSEDYEKNMNQVMNGNIWEGEVDGRKKNGETYFVKATAIPEMKGNTVQRITIYREDLSDKKRIEALSIKDELTGLYNRRYFNDIIQKEIKRARRENITLVFAMADLDLFKNLNDCYGHLQGDVALKSVGKILNEHFMRPEDLVFRLGGEEFGCLFFNDDIDTIKEYLTELKNKVQALGIHNRDSEFGVLTISMGALIVPPSNKLTAEIIYKLADNMLYKAKASGRNQIEFDVFR